MLAVMIRLANENDQRWRFTRKGDKRPAYDVEAQKAARKRNIRAKQEAATERTLAEARKRNHTARPPGEDIASRMLRVMEPGRWYGMGDLARLANVDRTGRGKVHQVLVKRGWVEKARNPAYSGATPSPQEIAAGVEPEPQHLYRLTEEGISRRAALDKSATSG